MSLIIPKASWQSPPNSRITSVSCSKNAQFIITGMSDGTLIIYSCESLNNNYTIVPKLFCIGPPDSVVALLCYQIDLEQEKTDDNVCVSITEAGDVALWSLLDGTCLQTRHERNDGVKGILQGVQVNYSKLNMTGIKDKEFNRKRYTLQELLFCLASATTL